MRFEAVDGTCFQMKILGYAEPYARTYGQANLLRQKININCAYGSWLADYSGFTTYETAWLAEWLEQVAAGTATRQRLDFLEPSLAFTLLDLPADCGAGRSLRIYLEGQAHPGGRFGLCGGAHDTWLDFPLITDEALFQAAIELRKTLLKYPERKRQVRAAHTNKAINVW